MTKRLFAPARAEHLVFFDVLNYPQPKAVAILRQAGRRCQSVRRFVAMWGESIQQRRPLAKAVAKAGFAPGYFSLCGRRATGDEVAAFEQLRATLPSLQIVLLVGDGKTGTGFGRFEPAHFPLPSALRQPPTRDELAPQFITGTEAKALFAELDQTPDGGAHARRWLIDASQILLPDIIDRASTVGQRDPLVRAINGGAGWRFARGVNHWVAQLSDDTWAIPWSLRWQGSVTGPLQLTLQLQLGPISARYQLAPSSVAPEDGERVYQGTLSDLVGVFRRVGNLHHCDIDEAIRLHTGAKEKPVFAGAEARFSAFAAMVDHFFRWNRLYAVTEADEGETPVAWPQLGDCRLLD